MRRIDFDRITRALCTLSKVHRYTRQAVVSTPGVSPFVEEDAPALVKQAWHALGWSPLTHAMPRQFMRMAWPRWHRSALYPDRQRSRFQAGALLSVRFPERPLDQAVPYDVPRGRVAYVYRTGVAVTDEREPTDDPDLLRCDIGGQREACGNYVDTLLSSTLSHAVAGRWGRAREGDVLEPGEYVREIAEGIYLLPGDAEHRYGFADWQTFHAWGLTRHGEIPMPQIGSGYWLNFHEGLPPGIEVLRRHEQDALITYRGRIGWMEIGKRRPGWRFDSYGVILDPAGGRVPELDDRATDADLEVELWR